ncbi:MAG: hypothetical protein ACJA2D_000548 [Pseudohongiellaceae bacterium]|jgi:uncharacterized protein (DUF934 family)
MSKLIKDSALVADAWTLLKDSTGPEVLDVVRGKKLIVPLKFWLENAAEIVLYEGTIGIWLNSDETPNMINSDLNEIPLIALNFPSFTDGRSYSSARQLRNEFSYRGELRAIGDILRDQIYYLSQCGFNSFSLRHDQDPELCLRALEDFATNYQATVTQPTPLFRRR